MTLYQTTKPLVSHQRHLMRSRLFPVNKNKAPENGSALITCCTKAASPLRCFLISTGARCRYTRSICSGCSTWTSVEAFHDPRGRRPARALEHPAVHRPHPTHRAPCGRRGCLRHPYRDELTGLARLRRRHPKRSLALQFSFGVIQALHAQATPPAVLSQGDALRLRTLHMVEVSTFASRQLRCGLHCVLHPRPDAVNRASPDLINVGRRGYSSAYNWNSIVMPVATPIAKLMPNSRPQNRVICFQISRPVTT